MIAIQLTNEDFVEANRLHYRWTQNDWLTYGLSYVLLIVAGMLLLRSGESPKFVQMVGALLVLLPPTYWVCMGVARFYVVPRQARKLFQQHKNAQAPYEISWDDERVTVTSENYMQRSLWSDFLKWRENDRMILLYYTNAQFRLVPTRAFPDKAMRDAFTRLVHEKVPAHKSHRF